MKMVSVALFECLIVMAVLLAIPITIGVYVYRDANRRGMNAVLWTLVAVFAPSLIGFIIYLVVRESYSDLSCPQCNAKVKEQYVICPTCGAKLQPSCNTCGNVVSTEWKLCPRCTQPLSGDYSDVVTPVRKKDKTLGKILLLVILIPVILIVVIAVSVFFLGAVRMSGGSAEDVEGITSVKYEEFYEDCNNMKVVTWLDDVKESNKPHALKYTVTDDCTYTHYYLLYIPGAGECINYGYSIVSDSSGKGTYYVYLNSNDSKEQYLYCFGKTVEYTIVDDFELVLDGQSYECEVKEVSYNPVEGFFSIEDTKLEEIKAD
ncbi:MAG: zinc ribbon domain-containing protein [Lachnospira sp.]|nr:zinc ribbon domain-containing protein [Lachnospira sp.]